MDKKTFALELQKRLQSMVGEDKTVELNTVVKTNIGEVMSINIRDSKSNTSPNFYLDGIYEKYKNGTCLSVLVANIMDIYNEKKDTEFDASLFESYEKVKDKVVFKIINKEMNKEFVSNGPHFDFLDLSMVFYIIVFNDGDGIGSVKVTNKLLDKWKITAEQLKTDAKANTPLLQPLKMCTLANMITGIMNNNNPDNDDLSLESDIGSMEGLNQIIVTNKGCINGFGAIMYNNCLHDIAEKLGVEKLYIIPSSLHEAIVMPAGGNRIKADELQKMVCEVNDSVVLKEEVLSDSVYLYDTITKRIGYAKKGEKTYV